MSLDLLVVISPQMAHSDQEISAVSPVPSPAPVNLFCCGLWGRGGHEEWASRDVV